MNVTLISYPVETVGGQVRNILAGFADNKILMQRKDIEANPGITPDVISYYDNSGLVDILVPVAVYNYLSIGDYFFVHDKYFYNKSMEIVGKRTDSGNYYLQTNELFYPGMTLADDVLDDIMYINYLQDYYVEARIMKQFVVGIYDYEKEVFRITDSGSPEGIISLNISAANDSNTQVVADTEGLQSLSQNKITVEYREVYTGQTDDSWNEFTGEEDIIEGFAIEQPELDKILSLMEYPEIYDGYKNIVGLWHSDANNPGNHIEIEIEYLDINQNNQSTAGGETFNDSDFGLMYQNEDTVPANCEYIKFNVNSES